MARKKRGPKVDLSGFELGDWIKPFTKCLEIEKGFDHEYADIFVRVKWNQKKLEAAVKNLLEEMLGSVIGELTVDFDNDGVTVEAEGLRERITVKYDDVNLSRLDKDKVLKIGQLFNMEISDYFGEDDPMKEEALAINREGSR